MKSLIPSHKENKRYLLIEGKNLKKEIPFMIKEFVGILGLSEADPHFIDEKNNLVILSINRKSLEKVRAAFALSKNEIKIIKVSGTLKSLRK